MCDFSDHDLYMVGDGWDGMGSSSTDRTGGGFALIPSRDPRHLLFGLARFDWSTKSQTLRHQFPEILEERKEEAQQQA